MFSVNDILSNDCQFNKKMSDNILNWDVERVAKYINNEIGSSAGNFVIEEKIDGKTLLLLNERDLNDLKIKYGIVLGDLKKLSLIIHKLQNENRNCLVYLGLIDNQSNLNLINTLINPHPQSHQHPSSHHGYASNILTDRNRTLQDIERISPPNSVDGSSEKYIASCIRPEFFKTVVSLGKQIELLL